MPSREDMNKRFSYITRAERVLGRRASIARRFFGTRRGRGRRRRSLETNSARLKKKKGKWGWPTARARATVSSNSHCIPETAGYYEHEMLLCPLPRSTPFFRFSSPVPSIRILVLFPAFLLAFLCMFPDRY